MGKHNLHRKPSASRQRRLVAGAGVAGVGLALPLFMSTQAQAATIDSWDRIAQCEASGDWSINYSGDGLSVGGLQFINSSWQDAISYLDSQGVDTSDYPQSLYQGMPNVPTKRQQLMAGEALLHLQGPNAWVCNWSGHGNASGALTGQLSMFDGGPNPLGDDTPVNEEPPAEDNDQTPPPADQTGGTYTVVAGDTLSDIAYGFDMDWHDLYQNNIDVVGSDPDVIEIGMVLQVPWQVPYDPSVGGVPEDPQEPPVEVPDTYTVQSGDTLYGISIVYGLGDGGDDTWKPLYEANKDVIGPDPDMILPGQVLTMPKAEQPPAEDPVEEPPADEDPGQNASGWYAPVDAATGFAYGEPGNYAAGYHTGVDFPVSIGTPVHAVAEGHVINAGDGGDYGTYVQIRHADGHYSLYAHLSSLNVSVGDNVQGGDLIGLSGNTGNTTGPHLHFEIRTSTEYGSDVDPVAFLAEHGVDLQ